LIETPVKLVVLVLLVLEIWSWKEGLVLLKREVALVVHSYLIVPGVMDSALGERFHWVYPWCHEIVLILRRIKHLVARLAY
jgi:hypothetical protein